MSGPVPDLPDLPDLRELLGVPFTDQQLTAAQARLAPALIVAGAGSGKTAVMAARVVHLVSSGQVAPEQVLGLTFTNKAAGELASRIRAGLRRASGRTGGGCGSGSGGGAAGRGSGRAAEEEAADSEPTVATYHAYAGSLLREHGLRLGIEPRARLLADATRFQLAGRVVRRARGPYPALPWTLSTVLGRVVALESELSEHVLEVEQVRAYDAAQRAALRQLRAAAESMSGGKGYRGRLEEMLACLQARDELLELVERFRAAKRELDAVDFGDQLAFAVRLAEQHPEVSAAERDRFRVVLLDEYQDTSVAQRRMLAALFPGGHPVTAVGDPCQAIYGWRGASVANLDGFPGHFPRRGGQPAHRLPLSVNQRSGGRLLALANAVSEPLRRRHDVAVLSAREGAEQAGHVVAALLPGWPDEVEWMARRLAHELAARRLSPGSAAVLVRNRSDMPALHAALLAQGLPVEVVGLGGLLTVPAVADVVAVLEVLDDPAANAALLRLLAGPRWRIGRRDLQLLGRRAAWLAAPPDTAPPDTAPPDTAPQDTAPPDSAPPDTAPQDTAPLAGSAPPPVGGDGEGDLGEAVAGADASDLASLAEALADPGGLPYSPEARARFPLLARELRLLRRHAAEPLVDLVARVATVTGLDIELTASPEAVASGGAESLSAFLSHAAAFTDLDGDAGLSAFLAFLRAASEYDRGLDASQPGRTDAVQLLTVHKAKGLEWDVVALPNLSDGAFPVGRTPEKWVKSCWVLPAPLRGDAEPGRPGVGPVVPLAWDKAGLAAYDAAHAEAHRTEEMRLAYVALTRAKTLLLASGHYWGPTQKKPRGPSEVLLAVAEHCKAGGGEVAVWCEPPAGPRPEILAAGAASWPPPLEPAALARRDQAAAAVRAAAVALPDASPAAAAATAAADSDLSAAERAEAAEWDADLEVLLAEATEQRAGVRHVELPVALSASQLMRLADDEQKFARELARPMPRPPAPAAALGTRFHNWVEAQFGLTPLIDEDDLPGAQDADLDAGGEADLAELQQAFQRTVWASRRPSAVEAPFELVLGGHVVRGRIDAVYQEGPDRWHVVDWKTGREASDPLQLAIYRLAWAKVAGVAPEQVSASFLTVRTGALVTPPQLPGEAELVALLTGTAAQPSRSTTSAQ